MKFFKFKQKDKKISSLPEAEQLRLKVLLEKCDLELIQDEFNKDNVDVIIDMLTPLQYAINRNCDTLIEHFIKLGADVNRPYLDGNTPLIICCGEKRFETTELLLKNGADINITNHSKTSAIWYATTDINFEMVKLLLENRANPFIDTGNGMSSYEIAKTMELEEIYKLMEEYKKG